MLNIVPTDNPLQSILHLLRITIFFILPSILLAGILTLWAVSAWVSQAASKFRYDSLDSLGNRPVAIVFGAGIYGDRPSRVLAERIHGAVALYHGGLADRFLFSGDNSSEHYNELAVMQEYAVSLGLPAHLITLDYAGFSTYESCFRARAIFGVDDAILVSQAFHVDRAIYTCRQIGLDAVGLGVSDWLYQPDGQRPRSLTRGESRYGAREVLATAKAIWTLHVTQPEPTFLGPFEGLN